MADLSFCRIFPMDQNAPALNSTPSLYVVATPLGNLRDITLRALAVLAQVDVVAAEDTRHTQRLCDAYGLQPRLLALHQHNEQAAATQVIELLQAGQHVALVTDAGTPAISDPGARAVARVRAAGFPVQPLPGPCAAVAALSVAGLAEGGYLFHGFLPPKSQARRQALEALLDIPAHVVFYEAPHRIAETVSDVLAVFGPDRTLVIARELTKHFEQVVSLPLAEAPAWLAADSNRMRGEFVLVVSAPVPAGDGLDGEAERVLKILLQELPLKQAAALAAQITGVARKQLYQHALLLKGEAEDGPL